jgi:hypothetical protein
VLALRLFLVDIMCDWFVEIRIRESSKSLFAHSFLGPLRFDFEEIVFEVFVHALSSASRILEPVVRVRVGRI